jgi:hypothetical protein
MDFLLREAVARVLLSTNINLVPRCRIPEIGFYYVGILVVFVSTHVNERDLHILIQGTEADAMGSGHLALSNEQRDSIDCW